MNKEPSKLKLTISVLLILPTKLKEELTFSVISFYKIKSYDILFANKRPASTAGKPISLVITILQHLVIARRYDEAISFADSSMEIASADEKSASQRWIF